MRHAFLSLGFVLVRNPVNKKQISKVPVTPDVVDAMVLWTKNPRPMFEHYHLLEKYPHYWQFTLNGYGEDIEPLFARNKEKTLSTFRELSEKIGDEVRPDDKIYDKKVVSLKSLQQLQQMLGL